MVESQGELSPAETWWRGALDPMRGAAQRVADFFSPSSEASGDEQYYEIDVELPGVAEADIELTVEDHTLTVTGEKKVVREEKGRTYYFSERAYGRFRRSFRLPTDADLDKIHATHKDGVLSIKVARRGAEQARGRKIQITSG